MLNHHITAAVAAEMVRDDIERAQAARAAKALRRSRPLRSRLTHPAAGLRGRLVVRLHH